MLLNCIWSLNLIGVEMSEPIGLQGDITLDFQCNHFSGFKDFILLKTDRLIIIKPIIRLELHWTFFLPRQKV